MHDDPVATIILGVTTIFFLAIIGRFIAKRLHQPGVLGELLMGVFVGNLLYFFGDPLIVVLREGSSVIEIIKGLLSGLALSDAVHAVISNQYYANQLVDALASARGIEYLKISYAVEVFARYGVIFLLFMVGLESSVGELKRTGRESVCVAFIGVAAPMILGFIVAYFLLPAGNIQASLFIAATLSATSIGITARVLSELKQLNTREAKTILGAAILDDILGLIILAVVSSMVVTGAVDGVVALHITLLSVLFFVGVLLLGPYLLRVSVHFFSFLELWEAKLFISFLFVMLLAWLATLVHLASIIGAFTAGVILHDDYFKSREPHQTEKRSIHHLLSPLESLLAPIFFMVIGIQVKLETFYSWHVLVLASGLLIAAVLGKLVSGIGAHAKDDRLLIGIGMMPRGEVGLVFASIGRTLGVISDDLFSAIVLMVVLTTFITPPLLKMRYARKHQEVHG
jgi:Kef-type K+ transport system membrane component KefB